MTSISHPRMYVDVAALKHNYNMLSQWCKPAQCAPVIKADGYGLGMTQVAQHLHQEGAQTFFVATLEEAIELREKKPDIRIYVLNGFLAAHVNEYHAFNLHPVLNGISESIAWSQSQAKEGILHPCAVHLDTGMNRLGLRSDEVLDLADNQNLLRNLNICQWISHLSNADSSDRDCCDRQYRCFLDALSKLPSAPRSLANSSGIFLSRNYHLDWVRPGQALYGIGNELYNVKPVVRVSGRVLQCQWIEKGESVGYNCTFTAQKKTRVATVAMGYRNGLPQQASSQITFHFKDKAIPAMGMISMDSMTVDVTDCPELETDQWIDIWGPDSCLDEWERATGIQNLRELFIRFGQGCVRIYENDQSDIQLAS